MEMGHMTVFFFVFPSLLVHSKKYKSGTPGLLVAISLYTEEAESVNQVPEERQVSSKRAYSTVLAELPAIGKFIQTDWSLHTSRSRQDLAY
jgi:hypothetical protein